MQKSILFVLVLCSIGMCSFHSCDGPAHHIKKGQSATSNYSALRAGDIVFQQSNSAQCKAIREATGSPWTHVGIALEFGGELMILEAVEPVRLTRIDEWFDRCEKNEIKRWVHADEQLNAEQLEQMNAMGQSWLNRHYDIGFAWSDDELYCSELVYKLFDRVINLQIGTIKQLKDYDLTSPIVKKIMKQRYGDKIPYEEYMIAPGAMYDSPLLETVGS